MHVPLQACKRRADLRDHPSTVHAIGRTQLAPTTSHRARHRPDWSCLLHDYWACSQWCMVYPEEVRRQLQAALPGARIEVANPAGDGEHLEVRVAAAAFAGLGLVEQHRMVYAALGDLMPRIHALQLRTEAEGEGTR